MNRLIHRRQIIFRIFRQIETKNNPLRRRTNSAHGIGRTSVYRPPIVNFCKSLQKTKKFDTISKFNFLTAENADFRLI